MGPHDRNRRFKEDWKKGKPWLEEKDGKAHCKYCKHTFKDNRKSAVDDHGTTLTHSKNAAHWNRRQQPTLANMGAVRIIDKEVKLIDLVLTVFVACHTAVRSVDHLGELLRRLGTGSKLQHLRMHRTKCSMLIKNVIAPAMLTDLVRDIGDRPFSLIIDESTDVSVVKYLAFMVRYHSPTRKAVVTDFLGFAEVYRAFAVSLYTLTKEYLQEVGLRIQNLVGLGTDGAASMCSAVHDNSSVYSLLKRDVPNLQLVKCVCHTLHLAASHASDVLPEDLEFLVRETRNWFASSPLRRQNYEALFKAMNDGDMPLKLVQLSGTRWLAWSRALAVITAQWDELKAHFDQLIPTLRASDKCVKGRRLHALFQDPCNRLYLLFLKPITAEVARVNALFQGDNIEVTRVFMELRNVVYGLLRHILKPSRIPFTRDEDAFQRDSDIATILGALEDGTAYLPYSSMSCFEGGFIQLLGQLNGAGAPGDRVVDSAKLAGVQGKCVEYLHHLCRELVTLLPDTKLLCEALSGFVPATALCPVRTSRFPFHKLPLSLLPRGVDRDDLRSQWERLPSVDWKAYFGGEVPSKSTDFWCGVYEYCENEVPVFRLIANFALRVLSLPFSNAVVERAFSVMNAIKTKARNRMGLEILMAIMRIRLRVLWSGCCKKFEPTDEMYALFNSSMYERVNREPAPHDDPDDPNDEHDAFGEVDDILPHDTDTGPVISIADVLLL
ncbi:uncharacterized protein LOC113217939 [Frankliniella occidentalis]|uniref:Uncharacterized protein LOC113217939 n=1 Tax=Frankliniella occidentalis TaxID=133901 RepID=A0A6J1TQI9_FRAOC|nr:uncharacterized protein LOC113217939 [Frankliniella occidentalis]